MDSKSQLTLGQAEEHQFPGRQLAEDTAFPGVFDGLFPGLPHSPYFDRLLTTVIVRQQPFAIS
jgi:hypothetical protein